MIFFQILNFGEDFEHLGVKIEPFQLPNAQHTYMHGSARLKS